MGLLPEPVNTLVAHLGRLPGIGPRSAERIALHIIQAPADDVRKLGEALASAKELVTHCKLCGGLTEQQPCPICDSPTRDSTFLCVVEKPVDIITIEKAGVFKGRYHVLGGRISPINGVGPEDLRVQELLDRLPREEFKEVILALPSDVDGDATCYYLAKTLSQHGLRATRLAHGLPVGGGLEFADELTLIRAIEGRRQVE